ncbi:MAG: 4Fe-4S dicluster domain-containing protein [Firmicutes bacterium]|nr:4Fe-4S dicluster domain-containing protein [Bacillota bacterium]
MTENYLGKDIGKLGFGFMRLPRKGNDFDYELINKMVDRFLEAGFTYFDTAYVYPGSEEAMRKTLVERYPREKYQIASKLNMLNVQKPEDMQEVFETSLKRLGTDYLDFYLLHGLNAASNKKCEEIGAWDFVKKLKAEGKIKHYGFSYHDNAENLDEILTNHPDAEFVQLQINYLDWDSEDVQSRKVYETARRHNKPILIMEPLKGGLLANEDSALGRFLQKANPHVSVASWAVRFAASLDGLIAMLSGMNSMEQLEDNIKTVQNLKPLTESEMQVIKEAVELLNSIPRIPCTDCKYCVEQCPQNINIPALIRIYNNYLVYNSTLNSEMPFRMATANRGLPSSCITCKACEEQCPQHIEISDIMSKMVPLYETK